MSEKRKGGYDLCMLVYDVIWRPEEGVFSASGCKLGPDAFLFFFFFSEMYVGGAVAV